MSARSLGGIDEISELGGAWSGEIICGGQGGYIEANWGVSEDA